MTSLIAACLFSIIPQDSGVIRDSVDTIEVSHFFNENCDLVFDQVLFWQSDNVRGWRLIKTESCRPYRDWATGGYRMTWVDGDHVRQVFAPHRTETWEQHDRELADREILPKEQRRELSIPKKK